MRENLDFSPADAAPLEAEPLARIERELSGSLRYQAADPGHIPFLLYGVLLFCIGIATYLVGVLLVVPSYLLGLNAALEPVAEWIVWHSGIPIVAGIALALVDLLFFLDRKKPDVPVRYQPLTDRRVTVALTAYNDENSIAEAVRDFIDHPLVRRVIVVSTTAPMRRSSVPKRRAPSPSTKMRPAMAAACSAA
jgi:hypothetical protein